MNTTLKACTEKQLPEILDIFNEAILNTTALYEYVPRTTEVIQAWYEVKKQGNFPIMGAFDEADNLLGFSSYGTFRVHPAYQFTVEHSVYIRADMRGKGLGKQLLHEIVNLAKTNGYHVVVGAIDAENTSSIHLHEQAGFEYSGTIKEAGYKFERWLDLVFYQRILK